MSALSYTTARGLQMALNEKTGSRLTPDGAFGPKSIAQLKAFQNNVKVAVTGEYDAATEAIIGAFINTKYLTEDSYRSAAASLSVPISYVKAVTEVEAQGSGFLPDGRALILFERHKLYAAARKHLTADVIQGLISTYPNIINPVSGGYIGKEAEYDRLAKAIQITNEDDAIYASSWGLFQIMGFNYADAGFSSLKGFRQAMESSEQEQLFAFVSLVRKNVNWWAALKTGNFDLFASLYNGPKYRDNKYGEKLVAAEKKWRS